MRRALLPLVALLVLVPLAAGTPAAASPSHAATDFAVEIGENGDAVWTVTTHYRLENASDRAAFESIAAAHESGVDTSPDPALFRAAVDQVATVTDRDMEISNLNRTSAIREAENGSLGELTLRFTWTNFAVVSEDRVAVEAAFAGNWFGDLAANQSLLIEPPSGYRPVTATPSTDIVGGGLHWEGPQTFGEGEPTVVFEAFQAAPPGLEGLLSPMAGGVVGAVVGVLLLLAWRRDYFGGASGSEAGEEPEAATESAAEPEPAPDPEPEPAVDPDLLSDEERVEHLLRQNDGRMKQARIVEETRWSNAKVSQLLSSMAEEGRIEKLRIGRENLISLPDDVE